MHILTLTPAAQERLRHLLAQQTPRPEAVMVSVKTKGCSGLSYDLQFLSKLADKPKFAAEVVHDDITVVIDPKAEIFLTGSTMDYKEGMERSGFDFINPNEVGRCGCGESFTVANPNSGG